MEAVTVPVPDVVFDCITMELVGGNEVEAYVVIGLVETEK